MTRDMICIICPRGCRLTAHFDEAGGVTAVTGAGCRRGEAYAVSECTAPVRTVTSTVRTESGKMLPVKTASPIPKALMREAMRAINTAVASDNTHLGDTVIDDLVGTGIPLVATQSAEEL